MEVKGYNILIISANVGSLFEEPKLIPGWCWEIKRVINRFQPDLIEFTFQEIGGKDSAFMGALSDFEKLLKENIISPTNSPKLYCSGLLFENDLKSANFTAMASLFLLNQKAANDFELWDFDKQSFHKFSHFLTSSDFVRPLSKISFAKHFRFEGTKSRKGFLQTKWKILNEVHSFVNIHMYHDDKNTSAVAKIPSEYAIKREEALAEMVRKCGLVNEQSAIISGDYNIRLDGDVIVWLNSKFSHRHLTDTVKLSGESLEQLKSLDNLPSQKPVTLEDKNFDFKYSSEVFCGAVMRPKLQKFDREVSRFNKNHPDMVLNEMEINFDPTYCFGAESTENGESKVYATKRIPAWCDRVTFSNRMKELMKYPIYDSIYGKYNTGDHSPVFLSFGLGEVPPPKEEEDETTILREHKFKLKYFKTATFCQLCSSFIWGITSPQGYQCTQCKYAVHKKSKCKDFVPKNCGARLRKPTLEQLELAEKLAQNGINELSGSIKFSRMNSEPNLSASHSSSSLGKTESEKETKK